MKRVICVCVAVVLAAGCGASNVPDSRPMGALGVKQSAGDFCAVVQSFAAASKESSPYTSTRGGQMLDFLWHTKEKPEGAASCTVSAATQEAGPATLLCSFDPGSDANGRYQALVKQ